MARVKQSQVEVDWLRYLVGSLKQTRDTQFFLTPHGFKPEDSAPNLLSGGTEATKAVSNFPRLSWYSSSRAGGGYEKSFEIWDLWGTHVSLKRIS